MWGVCLDYETIYVKLYQRVVQYEADSINNEAVISLPRNYKIGIEKIKKLQVSPKYIYGQHVSPSNHPNISGIVIDIHWHFKQDCYFYKIKIGKKIKSKRYYDSDLIICSFEGGC